MNQLKNSSFWLMKHWSKKIKNKKITMLFLRWFYYDTNCKSNWNYRLHVKQQDQETSALRYKFAHTGCYYTYFIKSTVSIS